MQLENENESMCYAEINNNAFLDRKSLLKANLAFKLSSCQSIRNPDPECCVCKSFKQFKCVLHGPPPSPRHVNWAGILCVHMHSVVTCVAHSSPRRCCVHAPMQDAVECMHSTALSKCVHANTLARRNELRT